jgi:putative effector of murein hydrolase
VLATALTTLLLLSWLDYPVADFQALAAPLGWALGPAIVALAAVTDLVRPLLIGRTRAALLAITGGALFGLSFCWAVARVTGLDESLVAALTVKTISSPFLIAILGQEGPVGLAAALSVTTGVISAMLVPPMLDRLKITDPDTRALALGVSGHLVASEYAIRSNPARGGLAIIGLVITGLMAALLLPLLWGRLL